jgi:hypothetical protein
MAEERTMRIAAMALFAVMAAQAKTPVQRSDLIRVTVCMQEQADFSTAAQAKGIAAKMFAGVGVEIAWRDTSACPPQSILISLSEPAPASFRPGALAYAMPYEGTRIVLFYDRIAQSSHSLRPHLMAHVMVHEITHILEGVAQHSEEGVMKAHWSHQDYEQMIGNCLSFAAQDVELIHYGLQARASHLKAAERMAVRSVNTFPR